MLPWKQNHLFQTRNIFVGLFVYAVLHKHYKDTIGMFSIRVHVKIRQILKEVKGKIGIK